MIQVRKSEERGHFDFGWLNTHHTFSFSDYHDPKHMGFRSLRVINEDFVAPAEGFDTHPHRDMEIITYILEGELAHKDSMGNGSTIKVGDVQRMTAGTGVTHSEFNASKADKVHLLQIWILPEKKGLTPSYEQKNFSYEDKHNRLRLVASEDGREGSVTVHQDVNLHACVLESGKSLEYSLASGRSAWLQVARGEVVVNGKKLRQGDGAAVNDEKNLSMKADSFSEFLLFDLG